jgi:hypothetical protein
MLNVKPEDVSVIISMAPCVSREAGGCSYVAASCCYRMSLTRRAVLYAKLLQLETFWREKCRLLGNKNPVRTSQETYYISATDSSLFMLSKIWGFTAVNTRAEVFRAVTMKNIVFWDVTPCGSCNNQLIVGTYRLQLLSSQLASVASYC